MIEVSTYFGIDLTENIETIWGLSLNGGKNGGFHQFGEIISEINSSLQKNTYFVCSMDHRKVFEGIFFAVEVEVGEPRGDSESRFMAARSILPSILTEMENIISDLYSNKKSCKFLNNTLSVSKQKEFLDKFRVLSSWIKNGNMEHISVVESV